MNNVVDRLVYLDPETNEITPWLATDWKVENDSQDFTFTLRQGVSFSDGTPFDAQNAKANIEQWAFGSTSQGIAPSSDYDQVSTVEAPDANTLKVKLKSPDSSFLTVLAWGQSGFISNSALALSNDEQSKAENVIGTGPFVVDSTVVDQEVTLKKRADYNWGPERLANHGAAYLDSVKFVYISEPSSRAGALQSGQVDLFRGAQAVDEKVLKQSGYQIIPGRVRSGLAYDLSLRASNPILSDIRVRQAIQHGVDSQSIVRDVLSDSYQTAQSVISRGSFGSIDLSSKFAYDPDQSAKLLEEAGWSKGSDGIYEKDGQPLRITAAASAQDQASKQVFELISQQLKQIGIDFVATVGDSQYLTKASKDNSIGSYTSTTHDFDAIATFYDPRQSNRLLTPLPDYEKLVDQYRAVPWDDTAGREKATQALEEYLIDNALVVPIHDVVHVHAATNKVHGVTFDARARFELANIWKEQ